MNVKLGICALVLLAILVTTPIFIETGKAPTALPTVYVSPSSQPVSLGGHFKVDVDLDNASNLYGYDIWLSYDPSKLLATGIEYDHYLNEPTQLWAQTINNAGGFIEFAITSQLPAPAKNGGSPPPLVTINFTALTLGTSSLHLNGTKTKLVSSLNDGAPIPFQTSDGTVTIQPAVVTAQAGTVGITGYKLLFNETMNNPFSSLMTIDYYWNFSVDKWNGSTHAWVASGIRGSSTPVAGYAIPGLTTLSLPYYVYLLPSSGSNALAWGDWLRISFTFNWNYSGNNYSTLYTEELNVHPGDIAGAASVAFPYLGANGPCNLQDLGLITGNWQAYVPSGTDPTSNVARADINGDGHVNLRDLGLITGNWQARWTNTPPT